MKLNLLDKIDAFKEKTGISEQVFKQHHRRKKFFFIAKLVVSVFLVMVVLLAAFSYQVITSSQSLAKNVGQRPSFFSQLKSLITSDEKPLQGETDQRINFLLLGIGGQDHAGPDLTDTIMIASFIPETKKIAMISLPRDLLVPMEGYGSRKINRINSLGEMKDPGLGAKYAADNIAKIFNLPIHYYARVDFTGFVDLIDQLGGVKVYVDNVIDDKYYPILGQEDVFPYTDRFEHLYIEEGWQKMDGELALKYARSRHTQSVEGSDFARARRQQKIITALKDKAFSFSTLLNPLKLNSLLKTYEKHISTNMEIWEIIKMSKLLADINLDEVTTYVFDDSPQGVLYSDNLEGAYALLPKTGDFSEMQFIINNIFTMQNVASQQIEQKEKASIEILNGTNTVGLASQASVKLRTMGYQVNKLGNALTQDYEKTVIYDLTNGGKPKTIEALKGLLNANVSKTIPAWLEGSWTELNQNNQLANQLTPTDNKIITPADILIILGQDQIK